MTTELTQLLDQVKQIALFQIPVWLLFCCVGITRVLRWSLFRN